jgi:hypothetical protein
MAYVPRLGDPKAICDICGFEHNLSALRMNWKRQMVCSLDWEPRHPQEFVKGVRDDQGVKPNMRPEPEPVYIGVGDVTADDL